MCRTVMILGLVLALGLGLLWLTGGMGVLQAWVQGMQHAAQDRLAGTVRALKGGQPGALLALLAVCFSYGVLHAAGPGHGKMLIGGYGVARRVPVLPLAGIALAASLAQAAVAVVLVYAAVAVLGWTRQAVVGTAEDIMAPVSHALVAGLGLWLVWRGVRGLRAQEATAAAHGHEHHHHADHEHDDHVHGPDCGHAHGPTLDEVSRLTGWRDTAALITGIAMRPCSGALFLLILTWQIGVGVAGVAGAFAMGLGTAAVTVAVAGMAVWAREGALASISSGRVARALPVLELAAGVVITLVALGLLQQSL
jgi:nickel/cobalt transporter (NicO) family protein